MTRIVLHIDRLVLRGVDAGDARTVACALQAELGQLLRADGGAALVAQGNRAVLRAGRIGLAPGAEGTALGHAMAVRIAGPAATPPRGQP